MRNLADAHECVLILLSISRRELSTEGNCESHQPVHHQFHLDDNVLGLTERLDGLPLALATAGAYLDQVTMSIAHYLRLYGHVLARITRE